MRTEQNMAEISKKNAEFWDTPCGTVAATALGLPDCSRASLRAYDDWFFSFYPYLFKHIPFKAMRGKKVLEVGLGYGTVAQRIAEAGAEYVGLDIAQGPVELVNQRLKQSFLPGIAQQGNVLECPFPDDTFDYVVAIGCYHHTGDLQKALDETHRVLKSGGSAIVMVYSRYSIRQWKRHTLPTLKRFLHEYMGWMTNTAMSTKERGAFDVLPSGEAAPETVLTSKKHLRQMTSRFKSVSVRAERLDVKGITFLKYLSREFCCRNFGKYLGFDLYATLVK